jgi:hypothetical protein
MSLAKKIAILGTVLLCSILSKPVYAANKTISSVGIKVNTSLNIGDSTDSVSINYNSSSGGDINVYTTSDRFDIVDAEITGGRSRLNIGDEIKMKLTLEPHSEYSFKGTYSSSNISVSGGKFVSASKKNGDLVVNIKLNPLKGTYEPPEDVEWKDSGIGIAKWDEPGETSGYYDIILLRGSTQVTKVENYKGNSYNFRNDMTQKGTYKFRIRTVTRNDKDYGRSSDWVTSDEFYLDESNVSTGGGSRDQAGNSVGWNKSGDTWYFRFPDGSLKTNGWEYIGDKWYLFDDTGRMLTGWQKSEGEYYYLNSSGQMKTGWQQSNGKWYYLNSEVPRGKMLSNTWLHSSDGKYYYLDSNGAMCEGWTQISGKWYYFYPSSGYMAINTTIDSFKLGPNGAWVR